MTVVGIVIVSHSAALAEGVVELAVGMGGEDVAIAAAGGLDLPDRPLGTDAALIAAAIERVSSGGGVLVLMDLGSAILSAEMAVEMLPDGLARSVELCDAPLVEGAVSAAVAARLGEPLRRVAAEARGGLRPKVEHLGAGDEDAPAGDEVPAAGAGDATNANGPWEELKVAVRNPLGLHARPAAALVRAAAGFDAEVTVSNLTRGRGPVSGRSLNSVATLGVGRGDEILVRAGGPEAGRAIAAVRELAAGDFGESLEPTPSSRPARPRTPIEEERGEVDELPGLRPGPA